MENDNLTSEQSLRLISEMIQNTRHNISRGAGNSFLRWGYTSAIVSIVVFCLVYFTRNAYFAFVFFAIPVVGSILEALAHRNSVPLVVTYTDKIIGRVWGVASGALGVTTIAIAICVYLMGHSSMSWALMLPISLILVSLATSITGAVIKEKLVMILPLAGVCLSIIILIGIVDNGSLSLFDCIYNAVIFIVIMIIPGYIINSKASRE